MTARLPDWARSVRFRLTLLYSTMLFALAALLVGALYLGLSLSLRDDSAPSGTAVRELVRTPAGDVAPGRTLVDSAEFERRLNERTLADLRDFSFGALGVLFVASLGVGWLVAGRVLAPIARITRVANEIQASELSRRIELPGADDELKRLADTFDSMLERLDAAFAAQRRFVADASHELRTPLAIIRTNLDVALAPGATEEDRRRGAEAIQRAIGRMARLTDDLLALARLETPHVRREQVDLGAVLADAAEDYEAAAAARSLRLEREAGPRALVAGDRDVLKRAVANLLDNAVRLAPEGSRVQLRVGIDDGWAWLAVADEGPGIAPADQQRIFERFARADTSRSRGRGRGGSGLGLAIVREIASAHGGGVRLDSQPGSGSTFALWLPRAGAA
jgi:signal transduction histidine kinase